MPAGSQEAIEFILSLEFFGIKLGLHNITKLLRALGDPHTRFKSIHIAGTNGKGSTAAILESVLLAAGYRVGLYTSPHLIHFSERIRVNRQLITEAEIATILEQFRTEVEKTKASFFEVTTAIAFKYFEQEKVDIAIVETGLGGRLDATSLVTPLVSVITNIEKDHTQCLGNRLDQIAMEKAGIIKPNGITVLGSDIRKGAAKVIRESAAQKANDVVDSKDVAVRELVSGDAGSFFETDWLGSPCRIFLNLRANYQVSNARTAIATLQTLVFADPSFQITASQLVGGFAGVHWPARLQTVHENPVVVIDVGHNLAGIRAWKKAVEDLFPANRYKVRTLLVALMADKDRGGIARVLSGCFDHVVVTQTKNHKSLAAATLADSFDRNQQPTRITESALQGIDLCFELTRPDGIIFVLGSHYFIADLMHDKRLDANFVSSSTGREVAAGLNS